MFLEPSQKPKVMYTDSSLDFGKSCEALSWNHGTSTLYRTETKGIAEMRYTASKRGNISRIVAIRRMISGGQILWNAIAIWDMSKISCQTGKFRMTEDLGNPSRTYFVRGENFGKKIL